MPKINSIGRDIVQVSGVDALGNRIRKVFSKKRHGPKYLDMAQKMQSELLFDSTGDRHIGQWARMTVKELADRYRDEHLSKTRAAGNRSYLNIITGKWGSYRIAGLNIGLVRPWVWKLLEDRKFSGFTILKIVRYFVRILNWGCEVQAIPRNPLGDFRQGHLVDMALKKEFKRLVRPRRVIIDREAFDRLIMDIPQWLKDVTVLAWCTGMREGEICGLQWSQITGTRIKFMPAEDKECDEKTVVLDAEAMALLDRIQAERLISGIDDGIVFRGPTGRPATVYVIGHQFRKYADAAGFTNLRFHDLRHCYQVRMQIGRAHV